MKFEGFPLVYTIKERRLTEWVEMKNVYPILVTPLMHENSWY